MGFINSVKLFFKISIFVFFCGDVRGVFYYFKYVICYVEDGVIWSLYLYFFVSVGDLFEFIGEELVVC